MAYAIMGGLAVATLLTLVFLPALYVAFFRITQPETGGEPALPEATAAATIGAVDARPNLGAMATLGEQ